MFCNKNNIKVANKQAHKLSWSLSLSLSLSNKQTMTHFKKPVKQFHNRQSANKQSMNERTTERTNERTNEKVQVLTDCNVFLNIDFSFTRALALKRISIVVFSKGQLCWNIVQCNNKNNRRRLNSVYPKYITCFTPCELIAHPATSFGNN